MRRRCFVAAIGTCLTGCNTLGTELYSDGGETESERATDTPDRPAIDCESASRPVADAVADDGVNPPAYPPPPEGDAGTRWVRRHEEAYVGNESLLDHGLDSWSGLSVDHSESEPYSDGVIVRLKYTYWYEVGTAVGDSPIITAAYYVDERGALRAASNRYDAEVDPITDGSPVVCF